MMRNTKVIIVLGVFSLIALPMIAQRTRYFTKRPRPVHRRSIPNTEPSFYRTRHDPRTPRPIVRRQVHNKSMYNSNSAEKKHARVMEEEQMGTMADVSEMSDIGV